MARSGDVSRYALYGEGVGAIAPEFLHIEPISERSSLYEWTISPHAHPGIFQLLLLESGSGVLATDGSRAELVPASLVALPSGCVHAFRFAPDAEGWVLSIASDLLADPRIAALCAPARVPGGKPRWALLEPKSAPAARLSWLLADLDTALGDDRAGTLADAHAAQLALILALAEQALAAGEQDASAPGRRDALVTRFREQVERHYREGWSVAAYARALGATAPTLTRACREVAGRAPGDMVLDRVLLEAMRNLTYSTASVSQIADNLGFSDPAYFARFFKARTGMTASQFRAGRAWFAQ